MNRRVPRRLFVEHVMAYRHLCPYCPCRTLAERRPQSWLARIWRWHTRWCPGWKAYQRSLATRTPETEHRS